MMPPISVSTASTATSGLGDDNSTGSTPWYQGDFVTSQAAAATSGTRAALPGGFDAKTLAIVAGVVVVGALLWRRLSK